MARNTDRHGTEMEYRDGVEKRNGMKLDMAKNEELAWNTKMTKNRGLAWNIETARIRETV